MLSSPNDNTENCLTEPSLTTNHSTKKLNTQIQHSGIKKVTSSSIQTPSLNIEDKKALNIEDKEFGENKLFHNHRVNQNAYVMDETKFGDISVFLIVNLYSFFCLGYCISVKPAHILTEDVTYLIEKIIDILEYEGGKIPAFIHGDKHPMYFSAEMKKFCHEKGLVFSSSEGMQTGNQVAESYNSALKHELAKIYIIEKPLNHEKKQMLKNLSPQQKKMNYKAKAANKFVRTRLFQSQFFEKHAKEAIPEAILRVNKRPHTVYQKFTRQQVDYYVNKKAEFNVTFQTRKTGSPEASLLISQEYKTLDRIHNEVQKIMKLPEHKQNQHLDQLVVADLSNQIYSQETQVKNLIIAGFRKTFEQNENLIDQQQALQKQQVVLTDQIQDLTQQLRAVEQEKSYRQLRKQNYQKRKKQEIKQGIYIEHYETCLDFIGHEETFLQARFRLAMNLLFLTGARIAEVLQLEKDQVTNIFDKQRPFLAFDRKKGGKRKQKAFLSPEGARLAKKRRKDYDVVLKYSDPTNPYLFSAKKNSEKPLSRSYFTRSINGYLQKVGDKFKIRLTSHSYRKGFITKLWKSLQDIEFVRQIIGHTSSSTTQRYIETPTEEEFFQKMQKVLPEKKE